MKLEITIELVVRVGGRVCDTASPGVKGEQQWSDSMDPTSTKTENRSPGESSDSKALDQQVSDFLSGLRQKPRRSRSSARHATKRANGQLK